MGAVASIILVTTTAVGAGAAAGHWPQWRGPLANGIAMQGNPPTSWSETENVKWKVKIPGRGASTPIVWGDQVFIQSAVATGRRVEPVRAAPGPGAQRNATLPGVVFGQAQTPPADAPSDGQRRRRPGSGGGGGGRGEQPSEIQQFVLFSVDRASGRIQWQKSVREEVPHESHHQDHPLLSCFNARSGQPLIDAERLTGPSGFYASPVGAADRVYLVGRNGTSVVLKNSDKLEILATNKLDDRFDASPAVVGDALLLRGHQNLYCLAAPGK